MITLYERILAKKLIYLFLDSGQCLHIVSMKH